MKSRPQARAWVYQFTAKSLRNLAGNPLRIQKHYGAELTGAQTLRAQSEMLTLAEKLEAKAARLVAAESTIPTTEDA